MKKIRFTEIRRVHELLKTMILRHVLIFTNVGDKPVFSDFIINLQTQSKNADVKKRIAE